MLDRKFAIGNIEKVRDGIFVARDIAYVGFLYVFKCPECSAELKTKPEADGTNKVKCEGCNSVIGYKAIVPPAGQGTVKHVPYMQSEPAVLKWGSFLKGMRTYRLKEGINVVGRTDETAHSDVEINDPFISRRSIIIEVSRGILSDGYYFKLIVKKSTNPVELNNKKLNVGDTIELRYGDVIKLGNTRIKFGRGKK